MIGSSIILLLSATIVVGSGGSAMSSRSSAAPPRSRKKSSPAVSACSLTRPSTKLVLPASDTMLGEKLELALLRKSMSGSAGPCSLEPLSWVTEQLRPDRQALRPAVDSTLSDPGSHGERAHSRRYLGWQLIGEHRPECADQVALLVDVDRRPARPAACRTRCCRPDAGRVRVRSSVCAFAAAMSAAGGSQRVAEGCAPAQDLTAGPPAQDRSCPISSCR